jgi:dTDP-4-dehydrorhamnose reductase
MSTEQYGESNRVHRVLVLGTNGMAGHVVHSLLSKCHHIDAIKFEDHVPEGFKISAGTLDEAKSAIVSSEPRTLVNCIGSLISASRANPTSAIFTNSYLPHWLASLGDRTQYRLIHISTDCVFSGRVGNYTESSFRDADDMYGRSKALGEIDSQDHLTIRTSIIGPELKHPGSGLFDWIMRQSGEVPGFSRVLWNGITTIDLARAVEFAIRCQTSGLIQVSHEVPISKHDLLLQIASTFKLAVRVTENTKPIHDKSLQHSQRFAFKPLGYPEMIVDLFQWIREHRQNYPHYLCSK